MKRTYTREKRTLCGKEYMEVDLFAITPEEHAAKRRKKGRPSTERQRRRNAEHARRYRVQKANGNFTVMGFNVTLTYEDGYLPEDWEQAKRDLRNWMRRVILAACRAFGVQKADIRFMGLTALREKGGEVPPPHSGGVRRADHAAERTVPADTGGQVGPAAAGRQL